MLNRLIALAASASVLAGGVAAQESTERFIPIGQSPGVSGVYSMIGTIQEANVVARRITVQGAAETWTVRVTDSTDIWIDRSALRSSNLVGSWDDLEVGRTVEVKCVDPEAKEEADWLKVAAPASGP